MGNGSQGTGWAVDHVSSNPHDPLLCSIAEQEHSWSTIALDNIEPDRDSRYARSKGSSPSSGRTSPRRASLAQLCSTWKPAPEQ